MGLVPYYEIVYETGRMSVACYENDDEAKEGIGAHHARAVRGEAGGPLGQPAERIAAVYVYEKHPDNFNADQTMSADVLNKELSNLVKDSADENGVVNVDQLVLGVRGLTHPMTDKVSGFDSRYKTKETKKMTLAFLEGGAS